MTVAERSEIAIPKWSGEVIAAIVFFVIAVIASLVAILNLVFRVDFVFSCIWLAFVALGVRGTCKGQGGVRKCLINFLGYLACKQFVESIRHDTGAVEIGFGYQLIGCRLLYLKVPLDKIEYVDWRPGQAPGIWHVFIWFDHDDAERNMKSKSRRKSDLNIYQVGPSRRKKRTEALGRAFVEFLCRAGATMVQGQDDCSYVRAPSA